MNKQYDIKLVFKYVAMALLSIAIWKVTNGVGSILIAMFVFMAVFRDKPADVLFWMLFLTWTSTANRLVLVANATSVTVARGTLVILAFVLLGRVYHRGWESKLVTPFGGIIFYILWEVIVSAQGFYPAISYLKLFLFVSICLAMAEVANTVNHSKHANIQALRSAILAIASIILIGSVLIIPFPSISLMHEMRSIDAMRSGEVVSLFRGMTSHSQAMGPMAGILGTLLFADLAFSIKRWDKFYTILLLCCPVLIYKSSSRTGMGALILGIIMIMWLIMQSRGIGRNWKGKLMMFMNMTIGIIVILVITLPGVRNKAVSFTLKYAPDSSDSAPITSEVVLASRQSKLDLAMYNFKRNPILGNGFQVSSDMIGEKREGFKDYLTAPVEKSTWTYAVLEEGGVIGMILFCLWLVVLFKLLIQRHAYIGASVFFCFLVQNLGEFCFFSMTYVGGAFWMIIFAAICLDVQRIKNNEAQLYFNQKIEAARYM